MDCVDQVTLGWKYLPSISSMIYLPKKTFHDFSIIDFESSTKKCGCSHNRWKRFLDPNTIMFDNSVAHIFPADLNCIQEKNLRKWMFHGLNHIPLMHIHLADVVDKLLKAWATIVDLLSIVG